MSAADDPTFLSAGDFPDTDTTPIVEAVCKVCGNGIPYAGRGRKPSYCDEHNPRTPKGPAAPAAAADKPRKSSAVVERAIAEITTVYGVVGMGLERFVTPTGGRLVSEHRRDLAESYRMLLETSAKFRKLFEDMEGKTAWLPIVIAHAELAASLRVAIMLDQVKAAEARNVAQQDQGTYYEDAVTGV